MYKNETTKDHNLLQQTDSEDLKFLTKKWYIINDQNNGAYGKRNQNDSTIKFSTEIVKLSLVDYSDVYILVTDDIKVVGGNNKTDVAFKNCHPFIRSVIHLNDEYVDTAGNLDLTMDLYNLIEYSDNYSDTTGYLYHYKKSIQSKTGNVIYPLAVNTSTSFKYQSNLIKKQVNSVDVAQNRDPDVPNAHRLWKNVKIAVPLKYISNFFRSLELPLINPKLYIELNWPKHSVIRSVATATTFRITKTELYVPVVTLNTEKKKINYMICWEVLKDQ